MSDTPKWSSVALEKRQQEQLEQRRRQKAEEEARQRKEAEERELARNREARSHLAAIIAGLKADPVVTRWRPGSVATLAEQLANWNGTTVTARLDGLVSSARSQAQKMIEEANAYQLQADQRDYIANSIAATLRTMGFIVSLVSEEHPNQLGSALILRAATASRKQLYVSVPFQGKVLYNVDAYDRTTEQVIGGGTAPTCDEAENVLNDMRSQLQEHFGVITGEISWNGKVDPDRILKMGDPDRIPKKKKRQPGDRKSHQGYQ